jgi:hypothetical protein
MTNGRPPVRQYRRGAVEGLGLEAGRCDNLSLGPEPATRRARRQPVRRGPVRTLFPTKVNMTACSSSGPGAPLKRCAPTRCMNRHTTQEAGRGVEGTGIWRGAAAVSP